MKLPCWMTMESRRSFISALSTILSSTVFSVMKRKTRTCFCWPILWARSWNKKMKLVKSSASEIKVMQHTRSLLGKETIRLGSSSLWTPNHGLKVDLRVPVWVVQDDHIRCSQVDTQSSSSGTQHEDELGAVGLVVCVDRDLKTHKDTYKLLS